MPVKDAGRRVFALQCAATACFGAAYVALASARLAGATPPPELFRALDLDGEANLPTWWSSAGLAWAAVLAAYARRSGGALRARWLALVAGVFAVLSADETAQVHEAIAAWLIERVKAGALPAGLVWALGAVVVLPIGALCMRGLRHATPEGRRWLALGGCVYVACALGVEAAGHAWARAHGWANAPYVAMVTLEECGEMLGAALCARGLYCEALKEVPPSARLT